MKRKSTGRSTAVFDFDEGDAEPFNAKRNDRKNKFFEFFSKGKQSGKGRGKNDRTKCKDLTQRLAESMCRGGVIAKETNANCSSSASDIIETDDSDLESNQARRQLDKRFGGSHGVPDSGLFKDEDFVAEESKVVVHGKELRFLDKKYTSPDFIFTADAIELKTQDFGAVKWPLLEIKNFRSGNDEKGLPFIELDLTEHGVEIFRQHLGHSDSHYFCRTLFSTVSENIESIKHITALSDGYKAVWRPGKENARDHFEKDKNNILKDRVVFDKGENELLLGDCIVQDRNRASLDDWSDLIYPTEDDRDAVTVTRYDYLLLDPDQFLSDTIIDFYIKYLQSQLSEADKRRFYFYNSFFYRKLTELDKNFQNGLEKSKSFFERVKRWTARVNIFEKDYLFIPIMQNAHWSLVIICHPGYLSADWSDAGEFKAPVILHLDSLEGCHTCVEEPIRSYLVEAWRERNCHNEDSENLCSLKFVTLEVPQQTNYSDCGLFLLHYVELFVQEVLEKDLTVFASYEWFNPADASRKRAHLQSLIQDLKANKSAGDYVRPQHLTDTHVVRPSDVAQGPISSFGRGVCDVNKTTDILPEGIRIVQSYDYVSLDDSLECAISDDHLEDSHAHVRKANNLPDECTVELVNASIKFNVGKENFSSAISDSFVNSSVSVDAKFGVAFCYHYDDGRIFDRANSSVGKFSLDETSSGHVSHKHTTMNDSSAEAALKSDEEFNDESKVVVQETKDWLIDSVGDALDWMEGKETVNMDFKDVMTQHSTDDDFRDVGMDVCTEGQPISKVAVANPPSEDRILQKQDGAVEPVIMEGGISVSSAGTTDCEASEERSSAVNEAAEERSSAVNEAELGGLHLNKGLSSKAVKGIEDGKSKRASQKPNTQCELAPMVRRITRSISKGKI